MTHFAGGERVETPFGSGSVNGLANGNVVVNLDEGGTVDVPLRDITLVGDVEAPAAPDAPEAPEAPAAQDAPEDVTEDEAAAREQSKTKSA